jgi:hypothetical protein
MRNKELVDYSVKLEILKKAKKPNKKLIKEVEEHISYLKSWAKSPYNCEGGYWDTHSSGFGGQE